MHRYNQILRTTQGETIQLVSVAYMKDNYTFVGSYQALMYLLPSSIFRTSYLTNTRKEEKKKLPEAIFLSSLFCLEITDTCDLSRYPHQHLSACEIGVSYKSRMSDHWLRD